MSQVIEFLRSLDRKQRFAVRTRVAAGDLAAFSAAFQVLEKGCRTHCPQDAACRPRLGG